MSKRADNTQRLHFPNPSLDMAIESFGLLNDEDRGAFYTKREVVEFMLDLLGYSEERDLSMKSLLDPGFGHGAFIYSAAERLLASAKKYNCLDIKNLEKSIRGVEISQDSLNFTREKLHKLLKTYAFSDRDADHLLNSWLIKGDFLLTEIDLKFDYVIGNPPYVRLENIDKALLAEYRGRYAAMGNKSDLYIGFFERSLDLLKQGGILSYICADRWLKNKYGEGLRNKIDRGYHLEYILNLQNADPFETEVSAYPAVFLIRRNARKATICRELSNVSQQSLGAELDLFTTLLGDVVKTKVPVLNWFFGTSETNSILEKLSDEYPTINDAGIKVGIGIATGNDSLFILNTENTAGIESDRLLPLAVRDDIKDEHLEWSGKFVINTFDDDGNLINLDNYPGLKRYFSAHKDLLVQRHVSRSKPHQWYRTIDKPNRALLNTPRLYIPDIMLDPQIAYATDSLYPHHNLYWATSDVWDIRAFKTMLKSVIGFLYIDAFSTRMRGGYYRYQAQTLKKMRVPHWDSISVSDQEKLIGLHDSPDFEAIDDLVLRIFNLKNPLFKDNEPHSLRFSKLRTVNK